MSTLPNRLDFGTDPFTVFGFGSLLIESPLNENEEQFRACVTELLVGVYGQLPKWLQFNVGRRFEREGMCYREFLCPAGSVDNRIQLHAQPAGFPRAIILRGTRSGAPYCSEIRNGLETQFSCDELRPSQ